MSEEKESYIFLIDGSILKYNIYHESLHIRKEIVASRHSIKWPSNFYYRAQFN